MSSSRRNFAIKFLATRHRSGLCAGCAGNLWNFTGSCDFYGNDQTYPRWLLSVTILGLTAIGIGVSDEAEKLFQKKDPSFVVIDEVIGLLVTMLFLPFQVKYVLMAFVSFRIMDIIKPYPARQLEKLRGS